MDMASEKCYVVTYYCPDEDETPSIVAVFKRKEDAEKFAEENPYYEVEEVEYYP